MEDLKPTPTSLIADAFKEYQQPICSYIYHRIYDWESAKDLSQDVFLRLIEYQQMLRPDTVRSFIYSIAYNLVNDYLRRYYKRQEVTSYIYDQTQPHSNDTESPVIVKELLTLEKRSVRLLSVQRRKVYTLSRFQDKSAPEISTELGLTLRTVENHLYAGRKMVREYIKQCI